MEDAAAHRQAHHGDPRHAEDARGHGHVRPAGDVGAPAGRAGVRAAGHHRVGSSPRFARQVATLERTGYTAVTLERVWRAWRGEASLPRRPVVLSFDDGYLSQSRTAARTLRARGWPGVLNLEVDRLGVAG